MTWTTLVGFHGSDGSHDALALGRRVTPSTEASLILGVVYQYHPLGGRFDGAEPVRAEAHRARDIQGPGPPESVAIVPARSAVDGLRELAGMRHADLVVVGSERARSRRFRGGGVGARLASDCPCPVAVAPPGYRHDAVPIRVVGAAFDGSDASLSAIRGAAELARGCGARLRVYADSADIEAIAEPAARAGAVDVRVVARRGASVAALMDAAPELDLLALAAEGPTLGLLRGRSVVTLAMRLMRPVIVVPRSGGAHASDVHEEQGRALHQAS